MNYKFTDIAGYTQEKEELKRLCDIINNRGLYLDRGAKLPKGIIFYGESGTGKTLFAKVMASTCSLKMFEIDLGDTADGNALLKKIKKTFESARRSGEPAMIFFDEMDKVLPNAREEYYSDHSKAILAQLLTLIDGMNNNKNFIFVATCNDYENLPATLIRPGRIDKKIHIGPPDYQSRVEILKLYAEKTSCMFEIKMEELAKLCNGFSCAAIETLINECVLQSDERGFVSEKLIKERILESRSEDLPRKTPTQADMINACRNIGCFIVSRSLNSGDYLLRLGNDTVCNLYFNGAISWYDDDFDDEDGIDFCGRENESEEKGIGFRDRDCDDDDDDDYDDEDDYDEDNEGSSAYYTKADYLNAICALMGGYVAEEVVLNKTYNNTYPLLMTTDYILMGISDAGLLGLDLRYSECRNSDLKYPQEKVNRINAEFDKIIADCYKKAKPIIEANAGLIKKLIPILVDKTSIFKPECEKILKELGGIKTISQENNNNNFSADY